MAAQQGNWQCLKLLLENGANVDAKDSYKKKPIDCASGKAMCQQVIMHYSGKTIMFGKLNLVVL